MAKGLNVQIVKGGGGTPATYKLERKIGAGAWATVQAALAYVASPQTYQDSNGGAGFADSEVVKYRATATNTDGSSAVSAIGSVTVSGSAANKLVILASAGDKATIRSADRINMLATNTWEMYFDMLGPRSTSATRNFGFGANISRLGQKSDGAFWAQINGLQTWSTNQVEVGGSGRTVSSFNDGLRHIFKISRQANGELHLVIDDANFGVADTGNALVATNTTLWGFGLNTSNAPEDNTLYEMRITHAGTTTIWALPEGSGATTTSNNGKVIDITTTSGSLTAIWQNA